MSLVDLLIPAAVSLCGTGIGVAILNGVFSRDGRRADAAKTQTEAQARQHEIWFGEAKDAYARVNRECQDCKRQLRESDRLHDTEMSRLRREVAELRDALIKRVDTVDVLLPYVEGMPDEKMREVRASNRAAKAALWNHLTVPDG